MNLRKKRTPSSLVPMLVLLFVVLSAAFQGAAAAAALSQTPSKEMSNQPTAANRFSSVVFPAAGNVYPLGYYSVNLNIGNPPKLFDFDMDTGSDITWIQCDAPCKSCTVPPARQYKPKNIVTCADPLCVALHWPQKPECKNPKDQCDYDTEYTDQGSSLGALVMDEFPVKLTNGSVLRPRLAFGCGYDQENPGPHPPPPTAGIIGLGKGKISILTQLNALGITRNVLGHCLSRKGGGYLFLGADLVPSSGIIWTPMSRNPVEKYFLAGPAELLSGGKSTDLNSLQALNIIFDSGSSYLYLNTEAYKATVNLIRNDLKGKPLQDTAEDTTLSVCWKGAKPFKSALEVKKYFKTFALKFTNSRNVQLQLPPEAYLIISKHGNVCLGILDGTEAGLENNNLIGDIAMQDTMVIYDNEKQQIGWVPANCDRLPHVDRDYNEDISKCHAANFGILEDYCPATDASQNNSKLVQKRKF